MLLVDFYAHARYRDLKPSEFDDLAVRLEERIVQLGRDFSAGYRSDGQSELVYSLTEGTVKASTRIIAYVMAAYVTVSQYPEFRKGVLQLYHDASVAGTLMMSTFQNVTGVRDREIIYKRTVSPDVSRLKRLCDAIDKLSTLYLTGSEAASLREAIVSNIAHFKEASPNDPSIDKIFDVLRRQHLPGLPPNIDDLLAIDEERRRLAKAPAKGQIRIEEGKERPRPAPPRRSYQRIYRI
jgi:hypothetical protein